MVYFDVYNYSNCLFFDRVVSWDCGFFVGFGGWGELFFLFFFVFICWGYNRFNCFF